jgi:hypothetical protein
MTRGERSFATLAITAAATMVAYDAALSWASLAWNFPYTNAVAGSALLYTAFAFAAARRFGFGRALLLGPWLGLVDASLGWFVSWQIGPGRLPAGSLDIATWVMTLAVVVVIATLCAAAGGGLGLLLRKHVSS